ncbi:hypothetical protein GCM10029992_05720 [Glycomyces albus]
MSTWLITGASGMLARDLVARLGSEDVRVVALSHADLDITDPDSVRAAFERHRPALVVNCAAWTSVDDAETNEQAALAVNGNGPRLLAERCGRSDARLLQVSTDYVFAGDASTPYPEDATTAPRSAYGRTKLAGEEAVLDRLPDSGYVVRTAWLYGAGGGNFARTMIKLEAIKNRLDVVDDQRGQPTWTVDVADRLTRLGLAALGGSAPPAYTTRPAPARRPGSDSPAPSSDCSAPTPNACDPPPAKPSSGPPLARLTASWDTTDGTASASRRYETGVKP